MASLFVFLMLAGYVGVLGLGVTTIAQSPSLDHSSFDLRKNGRTMLIQADPSVVYIPVDLTIRSYHVEAATL